jgi:ABC-type phosphate/phosphonate transport system substrate-binding protein
VKIPIRRARLNPLRFACIACILLLAARTGAQPQNARAGVVIEIFSGVNIDDAQAAAQLWIDAMLRRTGGRYMATLVLFDTVEQVIEAVRRAEIEVVVLPAMDFLRIRDQVALEPRSVGTFADGTIMQEFVLLARRSEDVEKLADLRGKKLLANRLDWQTARLWLEVLLRREDLPDSGAHFGGIAQVNGAARQVLPVFFGQADACIVTARRFATLIELNPQLERELTVVARSPAFLLYMGCLVQGLGEDFFRDYIEIAQGLHRDISGRQLLTLFGLERTVPFKAEYLENLKELVAEYERLTGETEK